MGRIIFTVIVVVLLAVLVSMNFGFTATINIFGKTYLNVSVVVVAAFSFAAGVLYFLVIYIGMVLHRRKKRGLDRRDRSLAEREKELANSQAPADLPRKARFLDFFRRQP
jgi:hypothetical protein